jgi:aspartate carbamoyltransferase regulatory subunit
MPERELKVRPIRDGTVIDHILAGQALNVLKILRIVGKSDAVVSVVMNVPSKKMEKKDIVKIESRELISKEVDRIALIAPNATINIVRDYEVAEKHKVILPKEIDGIIRCANRNCISNTEEPIVSKFLVQGDDHPRFRCFYCERVIENIADHLML